MSFKVNSNQQISFNDSVFSLTAREKKALDNSWAKIFADEIFPNIDEERFSVLYSSKASRPNAPVNVIIGALIIKELFDYVPTRQTTRRLTYESKNRKKALKDAIQATNLDASSLPLHDIKRRYAMRWCIEKLTQKSSASFTYRVA